jgi:hypothetical protein
MNTEELAYMAGILDGEGWIGLCKINPNAKRKNPYYYIRIEVSNTHEALLYWLQETTGVGFVKSREQHGLGKRQMFVWTIASKQAYQFLTDIIPYMIVKQKLAEICIDFYTEMREQISQRARSKESRTSPLSIPEFSERREYYYQKAKEFNHNV